MRFALLSLVAVLIGAAMVAGGVYGILRGDDDSGAPKACDQVAKRDPRLAHLDDMRLEHTGDYAGRVEVDVVCNGEVVVLFMDLRELPDTKATTYYAWLYRSRRESERVGTLIARDGRGIGSVTLTPQIDTTKYDQLVITRAALGQPQERPRRIVFRGAF